MKPSLLSTSKIMKASNNGQLTPGQTHMNPARLMCTGADQWSISSPVKKDFHILVPRRGE